MINIHYMNFSGNVIELVFLTNQKRVLKQEFLRAGDDPLYKVTLINI